MGYLALYMTNRKEGANFGEISIPFELELDYTVAQDVIDALMGLRSPTKDLRDLGLPIYGEKCGLVGGAFGISPPPDSRCHAGSSSGTNTFPWVCPNSHTISSRSQMHLRDSARVPPADCPIPARSLSGHFDGEKARR